MSVVLVVPAVSVWRASSRPGPVRVETVVSDPRPPQVRVVCGPECELRTWQRAVWQSAVWGNVVAENAREAAERDREPARPVYEGSGCPSEIVAIIHEAFAGTGHEDWAVGIAWRESRCQPGATNPNGCCVDSGLLQIRMPLHQDIVGDCDVFDPICNARAGRRIWDQCGRGPWTKPYWCSPPQ